MENDNLFWYFLKITVFITFFVFLKIMCKLDHGKGNLNVNIGYMSVNIQLDQV